MNHRRNSEERFRAREPTPELLSTRPLTVTQRAPAAGDPATCIFLDSFPKSRSDCDKLSKKLARNDAVRIRAFETTTTTTDRPWQQFKRGSSREAPGALHEFRVEFLRIHQWHYLKEHSSRGHSHPYRHLANPNREILCAKTEDAKRVARSFGCTIAQYHKITPQQKEHVIRNHNVYRTRPVFGRTITRSGPVWHLNGATKYLSVKLVSRGGAERHCTSVYLVIRRSLSRDSPTILVINMPVLYI